MRALAAITVMIASSVAGQAPVSPIIHASYTWDGPAKGEWGTMAGDSLKEVLFWTQPPDSIEAGKVDSTIFILRVTKPAVFYDGATIAANINTRRVSTVALADSFKLARPALGDSVNFRITGFVQCRKNSCSVAGSAAWKHIHDYTPRPTAPSTKESIF